ncbi:alpha,alpha-trehalose-phosphate synthase (UDP-forming) [Desulfoplanes sp.]
MKRRRIVVVSNRLPIVLEKNEQDGWTTSPGSGGLVTAMGPVFRDRGGVWIGWLGIAGDDFSTPDEFTELLKLETASSGFDLHSVDLTREEVESYYAGFSNEVIWPLFHEFPAYCRYDPAYWQSYKTVNTHFANAVGRYSGPSDYIWVHDYHLMLVARELREQNIPRKTGFFLHIPFPPLDIYLKLPWRLELLKSLLEFDLIGFQTVRDMRNFRDCVFNLIPETGEHGEGHVRSYTIEDRDVWVGSFPISIDSETFSSLARRQEKKDRDIPERRREDECLTILGVDRLDYTKGIPLRLRAIARLLEHHPELAQKIIFKQILVPSRQDVGSYDQLKLEIDQLVGEINGRFSQNGWIPIHYLFHSLSREELVREYIHSEVCLVTPIKDGMNLVCKEYCACRNGEDGALVLSEFAGAAAELSQGALLVNPYDEYGVSEALYQALTMDASEQQERMGLLRHTVKHNDIFNWANTFLHAAQTGDLSCFPKVGLFVPDSEPSEPDDEDCTP